MIIEETLKQRHKGVKNEKGVWITPAFPKLIYVLEEDNITEDSKYWYLTELAAKMYRKREWFLTISRRRLCSKAKLIKTVRVIALPVWVAEASLLLMLTKTASRNITADSIRVL